MTKPCFFLSIHPPLGAVTFAAGLRLTCEPPLTGPTDGTETSYENSKRENDMDLKSIATTLAFLGTGALTMTGCDKDKPATETPAAPEAGDAAEAACGGDKAEGSCGGEKAEGSCGGEAAEGEGEGEASCGGEAAEEGEGEASCGGAK